MDFVVPAPGPYHDVDYVVLVHFASADHRGEEGTVGSSSSSSLATGEEEPLLIHAVATTDDDDGRTERVVVTRQSERLFLHESQRSFVVPKDAFYVPPAEVASFFVQFFRPFVLGSHARLGTHCRATYRCLRRTFGVQNAVLMDVGRTPHLSSSLQLLVLCCEVRKGREGHELRETMQKTTLQPLRAAAAAVVVENGIPPAAAEKPSNVFRPPWNVHHHHHNNNNSNINNKNAAIGNAVDVKTAKRMPPVAECLAKESARDAAPKASG